MSTTAGVFIWAIGHCVSNTECRLAPGLKGTLNRPGVSRRLLCLSPGHFGWDVLTVVEVFELCWQDVAEFTEEAAVVEPVDPVCCSASDTIRTASEFLPGTSPADSQGLKGRPPICA